ncbi:hypothetical protein [Pseudoalteromonas sp. GB56]
MSNSDNLNDELSQLLESAQSSLSDIEQQQKREDEFAPLANERFQNNLLAFQKYYPDIYNAIENFVPREDFCLHVTKEMSANFVKQGETIPMYSDSPLEQCKEQVEKNLASPAISAVKYDYRNRGDKKDDRIHTKHMNIVSELLAQTRESKPKALKAIPERFPSAMVFGVGLGYHLPILFEHTTFDYIFIVEPDFELFYASLFCIEWDKLIEKVDKELGCMFIHLGSRMKNSLMIYLKLSKI